MTPDSSKSKANGELCRACKEPVSDDVQAVFCDFGNKWHHLSCTELDQVTYDFLSNTSYQSIVWKCAHCPSLDVIMHNDMEIKLSNFAKEIHNRIDTIYRN